MTRLITADLLLDRYGVQVDTGGVLRPDPPWGLLMTAPRVDTLVHLHHLLMCLESLRTSTTEDFNFVLPHHRLVLG